MDVTVGVQALFINFCVLVTLTFFGGLTYQDRFAPRLPALWRRGLRFVLAVLAGAVLIAFALRLPDVGVRLDLRAVPVVLAGLLAGPWAALLVALPIVAYRLLLPNAPVWYVLCNIAALALLSGCVWRPQLRRSWWSARALGLFALSFAVADSALLLVPGLRLERALADLLMLVVFQLGGLLAALGVLSVRFRSIGRVSVYRAQAYLDTLTGLCNRRQFDEDLKTLGPSERAHLIMLDLDHFKQINDRYGHSFGDEVLRGLGSLLRANIAPQQQAYRLGGEEFAVLVRQADALLAARIADTLREVVAERLPRLLNRTDVAITLSVGVAAYEGVVERMLVVADARLYAAKRLGRNRTVLEGG